MLTSETKRRINACRDILVGKLPQPSNQVELITLAPARICPASSATSSATPS